MNIAFFHEYFPKGGAERVTLDISEYLITKGYTIFLFTREYSPEKLPQDSSFSKNVNVFILPDSTNTDSYINARFIAEKSAEKNINILVIQAYLLKSIKDIKSINPILKIVYYNHGMPFWEIKNKIEQKKAKSKRSIGKALQYYLIDIHKIYTFKTYQKRIYKAYRHAYDLVDGYVTLCDSYSQQIKKALQIKDSHKLFAINNSEKPVRNIVLNKQNIVLFVGRLTYADKRVDMLIDIWNLLKGKTNDWKLIIVGKGPEKENLEAQVKKLNLTNVEFAGFSNNPKEYYDKAAILCMTSVFEGWGLVLTEAQANGVVPMAFGCSEGVKYILSPHQINGLIIPPFDKEIYAQNLLSLMNDKEKRLQIQKNIIEKSKSYLPEVVGAKWIELFNAILSQS